MCVWDGCPMRPEDEREGEASWHEDDEAADAWRGGEPVDQGDEWKARDWTGTPEERMHRELLDEGDED